MIIMIKRSYLPLLRKCKYLLTIEGGGKGEGEKGKTGKREKVSKECL
jgi:hypothetical protein